MIKNVEHYLFHKKKFLNEKYCENTLNELSVCNWEKHKWYYPRTESLFADRGDNEPEKINGTVSKNIADINNFILKELHSIILEYIESFKYDWFEGWEGYSALKFVRYFPDQTMHKHCDHIHDMFDGERKGVPILSVIGILNDDYEGGELIMFEDKKIDTKKGDLLIFPSNFLFPHEITPVTKGVRYSYVSWVW